MSLLMQARRGGVQIIPCIYILWMHGTLEKLCVCRRWGQTPAWALLLMQLSSVWVIYSCLAKGRKRKRKWPDQRMAITQFIKPTALDPTLMLTTSWGFVVQKKPLPPSTLPNGHTPLGIVGFTFALRGKNPHKKNKRNWCMNFFCFDKFLPL